MNKNYKLSEGVLEAVMSGSNIPDPIVQVLGSKKMISSVTDSERYRLCLSDGTFKVNIAIYTVKVSSEMTTQALELHSIIKLKRYLSNVIKNKDQRDTRILLILDIELVARGLLVGHVIGNPTFLTNSEISVSQSTNVSNDSTIDTNIRSLARSLNTLSKTRLISPISSLNPFHNNWIIKARVVNKTNVRNWYNAKGEGKLFSVDLIDQSGEIRCTAFKELVDKFFNLLEVDKVYYISQCLLQPINRQFCSLKHEFEMVFVVETQIEEGRDDDNVIPQLQYNLTTLDKVGVMEPGTLVDVIAVCKTVSDLQVFTSKSTNRELKKRELLLVDQSRIGMSLILWGSDAECFSAEENPVILVKDSKIYEYQGSKSMALMQGSQLKINPDIPERYQLKTWFDIDGGQSEIKNISVRAGVGLAKWMSFKEVQQLYQSQLEKGVYFQTFGTILLARLDRAVYKSCPSPDCLKKVTDLENGMYKCEKCNREFAHFKYRLLVSMNISDSSCNQWVTVFSSEAEKILGKSAHEIGEVTDTDPDSAAKTFENAQFKQFIFRCRAKYSTFNDERRLRVTVINVNELNIAEHNNYLIEKIEKFRGVTTWNKC